ncbi:hypothetical protein [Desulfovibrio sp. JC010]|uniref:hypothetical protein n=1 Tax=Desulfovibrio sp. JC010 TaxID=2593641 RepID=UPI0013D5D8C8|nr:hypothetical protein [Desulfovibrio sp. JC010]NDV28090.1 hypothetical protein [Desulfovibrio sp. JC010]
MTNTTEDNKPSDTSNPTLKEFYYNHKDTYTLPFGTGEYAVYDLLLDEDTDNNLGAGEDIVLSASCLCEPVSVFDDVKPEVLTETEPYKKNDDLEVAAGRLDFKSSVYEHLKSGFVLKSGPDVTNSSSSMYEESELFPDIYSTDVGELEQLRSYIGVGSIDTDLSDEAYADLKFLYDF